MKDKSKFKNTTDDGNRTFSVRFTDLVQRISESDLPYPSVKTTPAGHSNKSNL